MGYEGYIRIGRAFRVEMPKAIWFMLCGGSPLLESAWLISGGAIKTLEVNQEHNRLLVL